MTRGRAPLHAIEPSVGSPAETVCDSVGIFDTKTGKADFGIAIGGVVPVPVCVEQQIRRIQNKHASAPHGDTRGNVEPGYEVFV